MFDVPPEPIQRPKFAQYLFDRNLGPRDVCKHLGCSHEQVRRVCLPFDDDARREPSVKLKQKVAHWTGGEVGVDDWGRP